MRLCAVVTCTNKGVHRFPTEETKKRQWIIAIRLDVQRKIGWNLRKYSYICSDHFTPSDFETHGMLRKLKRIAVPSIFPWTTIPSTSSIVDISPQELSFNPANALITYSRGLPINFVEEYSTINIEVTGSDIDPLRISDEEYPENTSDNNLSPVPGEGNFKMFINTNKENEPISHCKIDSNQHQISYCDKSIQTPHLTEPFQGSDTRPFSVHKYKHCDKAIHFYTGLETFEKLMCVFHTLGDCSNLKFFYGTSPNKLDALEQFFIALMMLRRHKKFEEIGMLCLLSVKEVADIFITWIRFMALQWKNLDLWVDRETIKSYMPLDFYDKYPNTRLVLDATECPIKKPGLPLAQQVTFSSYKNRNTVKFLIGIAPTGLITYISPCYGGSATDRQILERSNILPRFNYNDEIMVDKGLNVQDMVIPYGIKVNMPSFFKKGNQINPGTLIRDRKVASKRVHVERIIGMLKTYQILKQLMNQTETILASDIAFVCAMLVNFRTNIMHKFS